jgi:hypothetical protein
MSKSKKELSDVITAPVATTHKRFRPVIHSQYVKSSDNGRAIDAAAQ